MMNAENPEEFEIFKEAFYEEWDRYIEFINYFNTVWLPKKENWSKAWRTVSNLVILFIYYKFFKNILIY